MLGSSYFTKEMLLAAKEMGVYTIVTDYVPLEESLAKQIADEYWMISTAEIDLLEERCRKEGITAVACGVSEFNQDMALELCERLGLPNYATKTAWHHNRDKSAFKAACRAVGAPVATDYYLTDALTDEELSAVNFPVVVKPVDCAGNQGVSFCHNREELVKAYHYARSVSSNSRIIVERMLEGEEYVCLYAFADGEPSLIAVDMGYVQPGEPTNCYIVCTSVYDNMKQYLSEVDAISKKALQQAGCKEGIAWVQIMRDKNDGVDYFIEMGCRLSGDLIALPYQNLTGFDPAKWMVECALGIKHTPADLPAPITEPYHACAATYLLWTNKPGEVREIIGLEEAGKIPGVRAYADNIHIGTRREAYNRSINFLINTADCDELCSAIEKINQHVELRNEKGENMLIYFTDFDTIKECYRKSFC